MYIEVCVVILLDETLRGDKVSMLTHTYSHKTPEEYQSDQMQTPG